MGATPGGKARSRWDETPAGSAGIGATPMMGGATPGWGGATPAYGVTPFGGMGMETPTPGHLPQVRAFPRHSRYGANLTRYHTLRKDSFNGAASQPPTLLPSPALP